MSILVTGATGYLGKCILAELQARSLSYRAISRSPQTDDFFVQCDILNTEQLESVFEGIDIVIHAAGLVSHEPEDAEMLREIHVDGTVSVLRTARKFNVKRVVYLSTSGTIAVSTEKDALDEGSDSPFGLLKSWPYYRSKYFAEQVALKFASEGLPLICLNPSLLLGPGDDQEGTSTKPVRLFLDDKIPLAPSGGIAFADVRDVAKTVVDSIDKGRLGERYLLSSANMTFLNFYQKIARLANKPAPMLQMPSFTSKALNWLPNIKKIGLHLDRHDVELASYFWYVNAEKAHRELDWSGRDPMDTLYDTVQEIITAQNEFAWFD